MVWEMLSNGDWRKSLKDISRYSTDFSKRAKEEAEEKIRREKRRNKISSPKCKTRNEIYTFNEFFFRFKDFFCVLRVIKYKFKFAKCVHGKEDEKWKIHKQIILYCKLLSLDAMQKRSSSWLTKSPLFYPTLLSSLRFVSQTRQDRKTVKRNFRSVRYLSSCAISYQHLELFFLAFHLCTNMNIFSLLYIFMFK